MLRLHKQKHLTTTMRHAIFACALWPLPLKFVLLLLSCSVSLLASGSETATSHFATDLLALLSFKSLIYDDPFRALASWNNESLQFCQWRGVTCHNRSHQLRVTALELESLDLAGLISPSLANLTFLRRLHLPENRLQGTIPHELGLLSHLRHLNLSYNPLAGGRIPMSLLQKFSHLQNLSLNGNNFHGTIPRNLSRCLELQIITLTNNMLEGEIPSELGSLSKLKTLSLWNNSLTGSIPAAIGNLTSLTQLDLSYNHLVGAIPSQIVNLTRLTILYLHDNQLTGTIPAAIGRLTTLRRVDLSYNHLLGAIPSQIVNLTSLNILYLDDNQLTGPIPTAIGNLSSLSWLDLSRNRLTGAIPSEIGNIVGLTGLQLSNNQLTGTIPSEIGNLGSLTELDLTNNSLMGTIPKSLGYLQNLSALRLYSNRLEARNEAEWSFLDALSNCTKLRLLDLSKNYLGGNLPGSLANLSTTLENLYIVESGVAGSIPTDIGNLVNLNDVRLFSNFLSGNIPATLGSLPRLQLLALGENHFMGEIPTSLGNLSRLTELGLYSNQLQGSIPPGLGNCPVRFLDLSVNNLTGTVPKEILSIPTLTIVLNVSQNSLTGSLPSEVGNLKNIQAFDVSNNGLSGEIPSTIGECEVLQYLYMEGNLFHGSIPSSFSQLKGLQELDLSQNNLSGSIPKFLGSFQFLMILNLSFNNFEGQVPKDGIFRNTSVISVVGNNKLCGGVQHLNLPPCSNQSSRRNHLSLKLIAIISSAAGTICLILLISLIGTLRWLRKSKKESRTITSIEDRHKKVSYGELLTATNGFSTANLIGVGSFGSVYKGFMNYYDDEYHVVAVKVLNLQQRGSSRSFIAECKALRNIRHRNLVKILTACASIDFRGNDFKALVYQFLPNGNLEQWLHPETDELGPETDELGRRTLSLTQRLDILMDVASALDYLHHHSPDPIVHCDIKPSNILLDNDMVAHVGDFGLASFLNRIPIRESQRSSSSMILKGTIGYVAPEYGVANKASTQGDVYSYGILVLEMLTGKRPTDETLEDGVSLPRYVEMALPERVAEVMDANLYLIEESDEEANGRSEATDGIRARAMECIISTCRVGIKCTKESPMERIQMGDVIKELVAIRSAFFEHRVQGGRGVRT